ncbi:hypothetical protein ACQU0X_28955 [Pseudovibrio ascidiaceicola]|uniref:hypothetical protein n=1 Tax=Pseudovibrio ascidiaceicola TaxID=285279 RepID=UPI003D366585
MESLNSMSIAQLLSLHSSVIEELRGRKVLRSENVPTGDLAEYLFCIAFNWEQCNNSSKAIDATDQSGVRYQIKGRRVHRRNKSRQLSAIRDPEGFDYLAAVLFDDFYGVKRAALIPAALVLEHSNYIERTNSYKFLLRDIFWANPEVVDVTDQLKKAAAV